MAKEKRLIYANELKSQITRYHMSLTPRYISKLVDAEIGDVIDIIDELPTVDAVEVVRCKDCKKWHRHTEVDRERGECRRYQTTKHETGYCDRGERRT